MADQDDADDDEQQAGDAEPDAVHLLRVEHPDQVKNPREDHEDAEQDSDRIQRARRVEADDEPENQGERAKDERGLPRDSHHPGS